MATGAPFTLTEAQRADYARRTRELAATHPVGSQERDDLEWIASNYEREETGDVSADVVHGE